jgi:uncharacterized protein (TIGR02284 family)
MEDNERGVLKDLHIRLIDSRDGYKEAGAEATQDRHQKQFGDLANQRHEYAEEIRKALLADGIEVDGDGSFEADVHRFFMDIKHKLDSENDEELLESILYGEGKLLEKYEEVIETIKSDTDLLEKVQKQYREVKSYYSIVEAKEEAA